MKHITITLDLDHGFTSAQHSDRELAQMLRSIAARVEFSGAIDGPIFIEAQRDKVGTFTMEEGNDPVVVGCTVFHRDPAIQGSGRVITMDHERARVTWADGTTTTPRLDALYVAAAS